jgi:phosphatidylethanolamine-binding protein (PEBP) family uncharacterized protein
MKLELDIRNFYNKKTQITKKFFCKKNGGQNISPQVTWNQNPKAKSYSLIMEDPLSIRGNTIINGLNTYKKYGWYGPCPPRNTGKHKYIFTLYALDNIFDFNIQKQIRSSKHYEEMLKSKHSKIIDIEKKDF